MSNNLRKKGLFQLTVQEETGNQRNQASWFGRCGHQEQEVGWSYCIRSKESENEQEIESM